LRMNKLPKLNQKNYWLCLKLQPDKKKRGYLLNPITWIIGEKNEENIKTNIKLKVWAYIT
jgi:hypothetical protein